MSFVILHAQENSSTILLMKKLLTLITLLVVGTTFAAPLSCPREPEIVAELEENIDSWCGNDRFAEGANSLFELETNKYRDNNLKPLLQDNIHDMKWLVRKSTQDMREHTYCLELICRTIQTTCADNKEYTKEQSQADWCRTRAKGFGNLEQEKTRQVLIENQQRKSRSNLREKMRAIEIRNSYLLIPLLQKFFGEYRWFTEKVPTFLANPL